MTKQEMVRRTREALASFRQLPPEERFRQLIAWGVIDANGEVLFGRKPAERSAQEDVGSAVDDSAHQ